MPVFLGQQFLRMILFPWIPVFPLINTETQVNQNICEQRVAAEVY